jgi:putative transcriptional regulator
MELAGQFLVAMPGMRDPRFARSVIFICAYSKEGAMGFVINQRATEVTLSDVFARMDMKVGGFARTAPVHIGGPVQPARGFVLHLDQTRQSPEPLVIPGGYVVTATRDILEDIGAGTGPDPYLFAVGYAGWGAGQLEGEIVQNGWLTAPATHDLVFCADRDTLWETVVRSIGVDPLGLSAASGRA